MKSTKIMLAVIATLIATWTLMSLIEYILSDMSLKECYTNVGTMLCMTIFGWIPSVIVACDLEERFDKY
jgi:peptidoglycan biosynthesis protein MviN/MurJ (putative lipid II flippase)